MKSRFSVTAGWDALNGDTEKRKYFQWNDNNQKLYTDIRIFKRNKTRFFSITTHIDPPAEFV